MLQWILWACALPFNALGYVVFVLLVLGQVANPFGGRFVVKFDKEHDIPPGTYLVRWRPWFSKVWKWNTTIGPVVYLHDHRFNDHRLLQHEGIHVRQSQDNALAGLFYGLVIGFVTWAATGEFLWRLGLFLWLTTPFIPYFAGWLTAWLNVA